VLNHRLQELLKEGLELQSKGSIAEAEACFARVRLAAPREFEGWHHEGMAALLGGRANEAAKLLSQGLHLKPHSLPTILGLGVAHVARGDLKAAESLLRVVVAKNPKLADGWHYLALVFQTQGRFDEAIAARRRVVVMKPAAAASWSALGGTLSAVGLQTEALSSYAKALAIAPEDLRSRLGRAIVLFKCHRVREAVEEFAAVLARDGSRFEARSFRLMALNSLAEFTRDQVFAEHVAFGRAAGSAVRGCWPNSPVSDRRLRVGFISPDLRSHSVAYFIEPLLQHLDPDKYEVVLYHDHAYVDAVSKRLEKTAAAWRVVAGQTDENLEATVLADAPDILVDLAAHTGTSRLRIFARRAAPVQITYLGYPNTTGVTAMDYRLVDSITDPAPSADSFATETLVRFAPTAWTFAPHPDAPEVAPLPALAKGYITFGAFNNFTKVTDETLRQWARLLEEVPRSRLLLKADGLNEPAVGDPVRARLRAAGIADDRVALLSRTPDTCSHLALYARVDIALDTFPYHGTTTTCEALWMGVPVVTLAGASHASRVGVSLLQAVGHPEWVANSESEYFHIATALAAGPARLAVIRGTLREQMRASVLLDHAGQASRFWTALRCCWQSWCASHPNVSPADQLETVAP
jgi:predicted O-linked N-acetylglucosamine transferase (SPINDLY family)